MADGRAFHAHMGEGLSTRQFLGYYAASRQNSYTYNIVGPDTSQFVGTSFVISSNFSTVMAEWGPIYAPAKSWQTNYQKSATTD